MLALCETFPPSENATIAELPSPRQFRETESSSTEILPHSPYSDMHTADQSPAMDDDTDQMPSPSQNGSEVQDNVPNTVSEPMRGEPSPIPSSLSPTSSKLQSQKISSRLPMARISSSPSRGHDLSADASADSSHVPVRGTLYSGPSGLWKDFFRVATSEPASPSAPSPGVEKQDHGQPEDVSSIPRVDSPCDISSSTLVTLAQNMSIRTSPPPSAVAGRVSLEISDNPMITTDDSVSSVAAGEPFGSISLHRMQHASSFAADISSAQLAGLSVVQFTPARMLLEFAPKVFYSRDIPHAVQDLMNTMEPYYRRSIMAREMFEAVIYENTSEDEPKAPRISIINDVDDDLEVTPAWEFYYSNRIWHSDGVPPPDLSNLRGCDCEGYCDPKSQTCSCLKRQQEHSEHISGFIYDDKGRLKQRGFPIFECNDLCGCLDGCRNRVCLRQILRNFGS